MFFTYNNFALYWKETNLDIAVHTIECKLEKDYSYIGPFFLYHKDVLHERLRYFIHNFPKSQLFFSVKSLSNIHILKELKQYEQLGLDVVSEGEIRRGLAAGFSGDKMVFAGVGKTTEEIKFAIEARVNCLHVESLSELKRISKIAEAQKKMISIALRLNPDIRISTHEYITTGQSENKFGIDSKEIDSAMELIREKESLHLSGFHIHLGSQIMKVSPYQKALFFLDEFIKKRHLNGVYQLSLGGGFGIDYQAVLENEKANEFSLSGLAKSLASCNQNNYRINFEPGRFISAPAGLLVCKVLYIKPKKDYSIAITNSGMSELIRPMLYRVKHRVLKLTEQKNSYTAKYDIVGPICETGDFLARGVDLPVLKENDHIVVTQAGAYASSMSSNYNSRPFIPEILIDNKENFRIIRRPQTKDELFSYEIL